MKCDVFRLHYCNKVVADFQTAVILGGPGVLLAQNTLEGVVSRPSCVPSASAGLVPSHGGWFSSKKYMVLISSA